jgi:hypothetical protein
MPKVANVDESPLLPKGKKEDKPTYSESLYFANRNMALRTAAMCAFLSLPVMVPELYAILTGIYPPASAPFKNTKPLFPYISLIPGGTLLMVIFTVYKDLGSTVQLFYQGLVGTAWACIWTHVMFAIMPGGAAGALYYPPVAHLSHIALVFFSMWLNISKTLRMFILSYQVYFAMDFMNPANADVYNKSWSITWDAFTVTTLATSFLGVLAAVFVPLLPAPRPVLATKNAEAAAQGVVTHFCDCMDHLVDYFKGSAKSVTIVAREKEISEVTSFIGGLQGTVDGMWWETFDIGKWGSVRTMLTRHAGMMGKLGDILLAMEVCVRAEDFDENHKVCMDNLSGEIDEVLSSTRSLLEEATQSAKDGNIDDSEKKKLSDGVNKSLIAIQKLSVKFNQTRKSIAKKLHSTTSRRIHPDKGAITWEEMKLASLLGGEALEQQLQAKFDELKPVSWKEQVINPHLQSESFFVFSLCVYARQVSRYAMCMTAREVEKPNVFQEIKTAMFQVFDWDTLYPRLHHSSVTVRGTIEILLCYYVGLYFFDYNGVAAGTVSLLIADTPGSALTKNLNRIQAVVIGALVPHIITQVIGSHAIWYVTVGKVCAYYAFEALACYIYYSSANFGYVGCLVAAFACSVLVYPSLSLSQGDSGDSDAYKRSIFTKMTNTILGVLIMTVVDLCLSSEKASAAANRKFLQSFMMLDSWYQSMFFPRIAADDGALDKSQRGLIKCRADIATDHDAAKAAIKHFHGQRFPKEVTACLNEAKLLGAEAEQEPRYYRSSFKSSFFEACVNATYELRHNLAVAESAYQGASRITQEQYKLFSEFIKERKVWKSSSQKSAEKEENKSEEDDDSEEEHATMSEFENLKEWQDMRADVVKTMGNCFEMMQAILENETNQPNKMLKEKMSQLEGAGVLESMQPLINKINTGYLQFPEEADVISMDEDIICRLNVMLMLFESSIENVEVMLKECLKEV